MTLIRGVAERISRYVVRHASPGSKEWAEALARESDFIENDWSALAWSLGSLRVLLDYRPAPIRSTEDLLNAARKFADSRQGNHTWVLILFSQALIFTAKFFRVSADQQRLGCILGLAGTILLGVLTLLRWRQQKSLEGCDDASLIQRYKKELERVGNLPRSGMFRGQTTGFALQCSGLVFSERGGSHAHLPWMWICSVLSALVGTLVVQTRRNHRRLLEQIATLPDRHN